MINLTIDTATLLPVLLVLGLSGVLGVVLCICYAFATVGGALLLGFVEAIASGGSSRSSSLPTTKSNKPFVFLRAVIYLAICMAALWCSQHELVALAYLCAVAGGITFPIAVLKLFR